VLLVGVLLASCGSDDEGGGGDDSKQITDVLTTALTSKDPAVVCEGSLTPSFMQRTYGDAARCRTVETKDLKTSERATSVDVSGVKADGERATATVALKGGDQDGSKGEITLAKVEDDWRVDDLSTALLRSQFAAGVRNDREIDSGVKSCLADEVKAMDEAEFRDLAYGSIGERKETEQKFTELFTTCATKTTDGGDASGSPSFLRQKFEEGVADSLKRDGATDEQVACVKREMRKRITDEQIVEAVGKGKDKPAPEITAATAAALGACGATG
jgi:hypothetical protein